VRKQILSSIAAVALALASFSFAPVANADPTITAEPEFCDNGQRTESGGIVGGSATVAHGRRSGKDTIMADISATCTGNFTLRFRWRIERASDHVVWTGTTFLNITGTCTRAVPCSRQIQSAPQLLGGSFSGNETYNILITAADMVTGATADVFPYTPWPEITPPSGAPLQQFAVSLFPQII